MKDEDKIFGFDVEELKVMFLIVAVIFSVMQFFGGNWITALIIIPLAGYVLYSEKKKEHWTAFKEFLAEFKREEEVQERVLREREASVDEVLEEEDHELLEQLTKEMEEEKT